MSIFQAPAQIQSVRTLVDGGVKLDVVTQELPADELTKLFGLKGKLGWFVMKESEVRTEDLPSTEVKMESFGGERTPSQKLRGTMYVYWQQKTNQVEDFDTQWYPRNMELLRRKYLEELD